MMARARSCSLPLTRSRNGVPTPTCVPCSSAISSEKVAQLRMAVRDLLDLLPQERVLLSQVVVHHGRFFITLLGLVRQQSHRAVSRSAGLARARLMAWEWRPFKLQPRAAHLVPRLLPSHAV